jgi:simple sugar transport system permease protein
MRIVLERRPEPSRAMLVVSPLIAIALTVIFSAIVFALLGKDPFEALYVYFVEPLTQEFTLQELLVKATPLVLIAIGLALCYASNNWNIGAEGQYVMGGIVGGGVALAFHGSESMIGLPVVLLLGAAGGAALALVPALLKTRYGANEILTSLMLVYVSELLLDWLVRGPWRDRKALNFPQTVNFDVEMPILIEGSRVHLGVIFALLACLGAWFLMTRMLKGFEIRMIGQSPRAARFGGFSPARTTLVVFAISGALAGLAGIGEVVGTINQLRPSISPGYGFTAIIVAFLGRLNPVAIPCAGLLLALSYLGGENAQIAMQIPLNVTRVLQGSLLFFVLACDLLILYRPRFVARARAG